MKLWEAHIITELRAYLDSIGPVGVRIKEEEGPRDEIATQLIGDRHQEEGADHLRHFAQAQGGGDPRPQGATAGRQGKER